MSFCTSFSVNLRPIRRLIAYSVFLGLVTAWRLAEAPDQHFAVFLVGHDRRRGARALGVLDHLGVVAFHDGHARVGGAQVNADDSSHVVAPMRISEDVVKNDVGKVWITGGYFKPDRVIISGRPPSPGPGAARGRQ
jgi:hypothetical protein